MRYISIMKWSYQVIINIITPVDVKYVSYDLHDHLRLCTLECCCDYED